MAGSTGKAFAKAFIVALVSLLAIPLCEWLSHTQEMEEPFNVFLAGIAFCFLGISAFCYILLRVFPPDLSSFLDRMYFYVFSVFAFTAIVDLLIGMTLDGFINSVDFYLHTGEPYLKSSYGCFINWWDGTFHWFLYILLTFQLAAHSGSMSDRCRYTGLVWVGSIMNSLVVFLPGNIAGKFGGELKWSYLLNVPYALFPVLFAHRLFSLPAPANKPQSSSTVTSTIHFLLNLILFPALLAAIALCFFRMFAAIGSPALPAVFWVENVEPYLKDPTLYPLLQMIIFVVYYVPVFIFAACSLYSPPITNNHAQWLADWSAIAFGGALQAQFSYVGPALHNIPTYPEPSWKAVPEQGWDYFVAANALMVLVPFLLFVKYSLLDREVASVNVKKTKKYR